MDDYKVQVPINAILKHYSPNMTIEIGTTKDAKDYSECEMEMLHQGKVSLFGFDDFVLQVK